MSDSVQQQLKARRDAFFDRFLKAMDEIDMSQQQLARELQRHGLKASVSTVNGWVKHRRMPTGDYMLVLPWVLRKNGHFLLTGEEPQALPSATEVRHVVGEVVDFAAHLAARYGAPRPNRLPAANAETLEAAREAVRRLEEILGVSAAGGGTESGRRADTA